MNELKQTKNTGLLTGVLSEKNLTIAEDTYEDKNKNKKPCKTVKGEIVISTKNGDFKLRVFARDKKVDNTENKTYKGFETICNTYTSKLNASQDETKVANTIACSVKLNTNDYVGQDGKLKSGTQISMLSANRVGADSDLNTDFDIEGVIRTVRPEIIKEEETGRLIVEFIGVGYGGVANPITLIVPKDLKDGFEDMYQIGQTCQIYGEIVMKHVGIENNKKESGFGRKAQIQNGFDIMEFVIVGGEPPYEEETDDEGVSKVISIDIMKQLMKERDIKLEALEKCGYKGSSNNSETKIGIGKKKPIKDSEIPF